MTKQFYRDAFGWGLALWLFGYILGFVFFMLVPKEMLGWAIMPFGVALTLWVLLKKVKVLTRGEYLLMALVWALLAIILDYIFLVKMLNTGNSYYKLDVYLYYFLTFAMPAIIGVRKKVD